MPLCVRSIITRHYGYLSRHDTDKRVLSPFLLFFFFTLQWINITITFARVNASQIYKDIFFHNSDVPYSEIVLTCYTRWKRRVIYIGPWLKLLWVRGPRSFKYNTSRWLRATIIDSTLLNICIERPVYSKLNNDSNFASCSKSTLYAAIYEHMYKQITIAPQQR